MKHFTSIWILLLLLNSCSVKKITQQYLSNDDVCFCGIDSILLSKDKQYDVSKLDFINVTANTTDTLINNKDTLKTWGYSKNKSFTIETIDRNTNIETASYYLPNGLLKERMSYLLGEERGFIRIGHAIYFDNQANYLGERINNYVVTSFDIDTLASVAEKYPICWKEALNIVEAKIGKYELLGLNRSFYSGPNYKGMQYYWTVKTKKKWQNPKYYYVDAVTGKVERAIIIATLSTDDML